MCPAELDLLGWVGFDKAELGQVGYVVSTHVILGGGLPFTLQVMWSPTRISIVISYLWVMLGTVRMG